ncbi:uncharacterized protein KNAG_0F03500 [Huiozyma naganishii CBS 8797]|uniref:PH domain-containing protein n=1 Tax=Huiozyma naganishii (strain ATCC MYA-139 / BCRC 22969 / CBS 8797 / KCTC 17520 / NBRC 10181 / NCYC 3082 / Yp74L-3) TaxID=1071383 RepID=J7S0J2_HUIN7|nr:hypothetical protein KNAG_0F03500 [Kazachstania naganishii CBS 8797]CCK71012.1 hypothetical protein KNAG_0F03500 [Kazachstania naganishii CBS 8797]
MTSIGKHQSNAEELMGSLVQEIDNELSLQVSNAISQPEANGIGDDTMAMLAHFNTKESESRATRVTSQVNKMVQEIEAVQGNNLPPLESQKPMFRASSLAQLLNTSVNEQQNSTMDSSSKENIEWRVSSTAAETPVNSQFSIESPSTTVHTTDSRNHVASPFHQLGSTKSALILPPKQQASISVAAAQKNRDRLSILSSISSADAESLWTMDAECDTEELANPVNLQYEKTRSKVQRPRLVSMAHTSEPNSKVDKEDDNTLSDLETDLRNEFGKSFVDMFNVFDEDHSILSKASSETSMEDNAEAQNTPSTRFASPMIVPQHVSSPFKVVNSPRKVLGTSPIKQAIAPVEEMLPICGSPKNISQETPVVKKEPLVNFGTLYLRLLDLGKFNLEGIKYRNAKYSLHLNLGGRTKQVSKDVPFPASGKIDIQKELSFVIDETFKANTKFQLTMILKYDRLQDQTIEVVKKVPLGKKTLFGKRKYVYEKKVVYQPVEFDTWDNIMGPQKQYGICTFQVDEEFLVKAKFKDFLSQQQLRNEWTKEYASYKVGLLTVEACFIERTSNEECIPDHSDRAHRIVEKYMKQCSVTHDGYLLQEGGDLPMGILKKRYFILHGTKLIGHHENSHSPVIEINLLNAAEVTSSLDNKITRNFTDAILFGTSLTVHFQDGARITLICGTTNEEIDKWYYALSEVIALNIARQPWVKSLAS